MPDNTKMLDPKIFDNLKINLSSQTHMSGIPLFDDNAEFLRDEIYRVCAAQYNVENIKFLEDIYELNNHPNLSPDEWQLKVDALYEKYIERKEHQDIHDELTLNVPDEKPTKSFARLKSLFKSNELNISHNLIKTISNKRKEQSLSLSDFGADDSTQSVINECFKMLVASLDTRDYRLRLAELYARLAFYEQIEGPKAVASTSIWNWFFKNPEEAYAKLFTSSQQLVSKIQREIVYFFLAPDFDGPSLDNPKATKNNLQKVMDVNLDALNKLLGKMIDYEVKHHPKVRYSKFLAELTFNLASVSGLEKMPERHPAVSP